MFEDLRNSVDFFIRSKTQFSRKGFVEKNEKVLKQVEQENRYIFSVMDEYFEKRSKDVIKTLDIGCKNWYYAKGQYEYYSQLDSKFFMYGVELDAYRLYSNFYSRYEVAKFYTQGLENISYIADDLLNINDFERYDYITWFLPFVTYKPLKYWGLPKKFFCPEKLLNHAYSLLSETGQLLIINQGEEEALKQIEILDS